MTALQQYLINNNCKQMTHEQIISLFAKMDITVKFAEGLVLFDYNVNADFTNPIVCNSRGIILYEHDFSIACYPFDKFDNYNAPWANVIDWSTAKVQEKLDGSIIKVWWNKLHNKWNVSTNSMIFAEEAIVDNNNAGMDFKSLFESAVNPLDYNQLNKNKTYIFELTSPVNKVVIRYEDTQIWHIGTRNNETLKEEDDDIGIQKPKEYVGIHDVKTALNTANTLCSEKEKYEGFVVVDAHYNRIKIKSDFFLNVHYLQSLSCGQMERIVSFILNEDVEEVCRYCPEIRHVVKYYDWQVSEFFYQVDKYLRKCSYFKQLYSNDRKSYALNVQDSNYSGFAFTFYDSTDNVKQYIKKIEHKRIAKHIKKYGM